MWRKLWFNDQIANTFQQLQSTGLVEYDMGEGVFKNAAKQGAFNTNWLFFGNTTGDRDCFLWHRIMFTSLNFVPEFCRMRCHKVVVRINTVKELFKFVTMAGALAHEYSLITPIHGKCGIDSRDYSDTPYDAFFYCASLTEGQEKYAIIRDAVDRHFSEDHKVTLKRSCTEMERGFGPTNGPFWQSMPNEDRDYERHINDICPPHYGAFTQADWHKNSIFLHWIKFANTFGDKTWLEVPSVNDDGDFLTMSAVPWQDIKHLPKGGELNGTEYARMQGLTDALPAPAKKRKQPAKRGKRKRNAKGQYTKPKGE